MGDAMNQMGKNDLMLTIQKLHRWRMAFFGLIILLAGIAIGTAATLILSRERLTAPPPGPEIAGERMIRNLQRHLQLSPEQAQEIKPILQKHLRRLHEIRMKVRPKIVEQLRLMNEEISSLLNDHQKELWQQHLQRLQRKLQEPARPRRPGPHRPPPEHRPR